MLDASISFTGPEGHSHPPLGLFLSHNKQALETDSEDPEKAHLSCKHFPREIEAIIHHYWTNRVNLRHSHVKHPFTKPLSPVTALGERRGCQGQNRLQTLEQEHLLAFLCSEVIYL